MAISGSTRLNAGAVLITQRSQVQILPPLPGETPSQRSSEGAVSRLLLTDLLTNDIWTSSSSSTGTWISAASREQLHGDATAHLIRACSAHQLRPGTARHVYTRIGQRRCGYGARLPVRSADGSQ